jgi:hypothetical protein
VTRRLAPGLPGHLLLVSPFLPTWALAVYAVAAALLMLAYFTGAAWLAVIGGLVGAPPLLALGIANFVKGRRGSANTSTS